MKQIPLTKGYVALVDDEDFERVNAFKWTALVTGQNIKRVYAYRREDWDNERRVWRRQVLMHRFIMEAPDGSDVDHINADTLDNRRVNLRICTRSQNLARARRINKFGFRGVRKADDEIWFVAQCTAGGVKHTSKGHTTAEDAARAYDEMARRLHGEFARPNFDAG